MGVDIWTPPHIVPLRSSNNAVTAELFSTTTLNVLTESLKDDEKAHVEYVLATIEESRGFSKAILIALRHVAEARGFKTFAEETKLNRETLYKTLTEDDNPTLESLSKMLDVLGLDIAVKPKSKKVS